MCQGWEGNFPEHGNENWGPTETQDTFSSCKALFHGVGSLINTGNILTQSSSYIATDGQSTIPSRCRVHFGADDQILNFFELQLLSFFSPFM
jgi:hypothetical protein